MSRAAAVAGRPSHRGRRPCRLLAAVLAVLGSLLLLVPGCARKTGPGAPAGDGAAADGSSAVPDVPARVPAADVAEVALAAAPAADGSTVPPSTVDVGSEAVPEVAAGPEPGRADLDPSNDGDSGPPAAIPDCEARLKAAGVEHRSEQPMSRRAGRDGPECRVEQPITYRTGPGGIEWSPRPLVNCGMALALARFETIVQEEAERWLGSRVRRIEQAGTYGCRRIARFPGLMSEHSYANAIDVRSFVLHDGRTVTVVRHFGPLGEEPSTPEGRFLRGLAHRLYDEDVFSCVLTRFWDDLHRDHFHLDLARYRVDGTR